MNKIIFAKFEIFTAVKIQVVVFWVMRPCSVLDKFTFTYVIQSSYINMVSSIACCCCCLLK